MTMEEIVARAGLTIVWFGHTKVAKKLVSQAAAAIVHARAQVNTGPRRDYSTALQGVLRGDELLGALYIDGPRADLDYYLSGPVDAAKALLEELRG